MDADLVVLGRIVTIDPRQPEARGLAVRDGRLVAVGTEDRAASWRGRRTTVWRLSKGHVAVPGFIDAHAHLAMDAWRRTWLDLAPPPSLSAAIQRIRERATRTPPSGWIVARGWDESVWAERRFLTRQDLDRVSPSIPILANRVDGHMCSVNSAVLRLVDFGGVEGVERGLDGLPSGVLKEVAAERAREAVPIPDDGEWSRLLDDAIRYAHSLGITTVHDIVGDRHLRAYQELRRQDRLTMRAYLMPYDDLLDPLIAAGIRTGFGDEWLRLGAIKVFADGSLGARTAALSRPYEDDRRTRGQLIIPRRELTTLLGRAHAAGFQLAVHAIGDRAIDAVVDGFSRVLDRDPRDDHRHRIEHVELPTSDALDRIAELGLVLSMQPNFVARWSRPGGLYERRLGKGRTRRNNPFRRILGRRLRLAFGSDGMPYGPLYGIGGARQAPFSDQRITPGQALRCYTANGAFAGFAESDRGFLAVGTLADFVVLTADPRAHHAAPPAVVATVSGGRVVYRQRGRREPTSRVPGRTVY